MGYFYFRIDAKINDRALWHQNLYNIILVYKNIVNELKLHAKQIKKSLAALINENYEIISESKEKYIPLHSGKYINEDGKQVIELVKTIPDYIQVKTLKEKKWMILLKHCKSL